MANRQTHCQQLATWIVAIILSSGWQSVDARGNPSLEGTGSRQAREEVIRAIPWRQLHPQVATLCQDVVQNPSIYRRLPASYVECDSRLHDFLVRNPDGLVSVWQAMGITNLTVQRASRTTFLADDGMGTKSRLHLVHSSPNVNVYFGTGWYEGDRLPGRIRGRGVVIMRSQVFARADGKHLVRDVMDAFIRVDSGPLDVAAKTLQPLFVKYADTNFLDTTRFVSQLSRTASQNPKALKRFVQQLPDLHPQVRAEFEQVLDAMANSTPAVATGY